MGKVIRLRRKMRNRDRFYNCHREKSPGVSSPVCICSARIGRETIPAIRVHGKMCRQKIAGVAGRRKRAR